MTAINVICEPKRAFMMTDAAFINPETKTLSRLGAKAITLPHFPMVYATSGTTRLQQTIDVILSLNFRTFDEVVAGLAGKLQEEWEVGRFEISGDDTDNFRLFVMGRSSSNKRCESYSVSTLDEPIGPAFTLFSKSLMITPGVPQDIVQRTGVASCEVEPVTSLLALIEAQRNSLRQNIFGDNSTYCIGGAAILTQIDATGISQRVLRRWEEDVIGSPIKPVPRIAAVSEPRLAVTPLRAGLNRKQRRAAEARAR